MNVFTRFSTACLLLLSIASVQASTPPASVRAEKLTIAEPTYDCATRQLTLRVSGGSGANVEFMVAGQTKWSASPTLILDAVVAADAAPILLLARESVGNTAPVVASRTFNVAAVCGGGKANPDAAPAAAKNTGLTLSGLTYDCGSRQLTVQTAGGNANPVEYIVAGQSRWVSSASFTLDATVANQVPVLMVMARQQSETGTPFVVKQLLDIAQRCGTSKSENPVIDTTPTGIRLGTPAYDCATKQLTIQTNGGNGTAVEYLVVGQGRWSSSSTVVIDPSAVSDAGTVVVLARQKNTQGIPTVVQQTVNTRTLCAGR